MLDCGFVPLHGMGRTWCAVRLTPSLRSTGKKTSNLVALGGQPAVAGVGSSSRNVTLADRAVPQTPRRHEDYVPPRNVTCTLPSGSVLVRTSISVPHPAASQRSDADTDRQKNELDPSKTECRYAGFAVRWSSRSLSIVHSIHWSRSL